MGHEIKDIEMIKAGAIKTTEVELFWAGEQADDISGATQTLALALRDHAGNIYMARLKTRSIYWGSITKSFQRLHPVPLETVEESQPHADEVLGEESAKGEGE
jgi:hypothetical protein